MIYTAHTCYDRTFKPKFQPDYVKSFTKGFTNLLSAADL